MSEPRTITVRGIETKVAKTGNTKWIFVCDEGKFYFYQKTKSGNSIAYDQFQEMELGIGMSVDVEVQTEEKTFTNDQGKEITYKDNWLQRFVIPKEYEFPKEDAPTIPEEAKPEDVPFDLKPKAELPSSKIPKPDSVEVSLQQMKEMLAEILDYIHTRSS